MKFDIITSSQYEKDVKAAKKRGLDVKELVLVVKKLADGEKLPLRNKDHALSGKFKGCRECHIKPDWLLLYSKEEAIRLIKLIRTGTHSDIFGK